MTNIEIDQFLQKLKLNYSSFNNKDPFVIKEWQKVLQPYDYESCVYQLDKYLGTEYKDFVPKGVNLVRYAKKQDENNDALAIRCQLCGKEMFLKDYDRHYARESAVDYFEKMANKHLKNMMTQPFDRQKFMGMDDDEFNERYDKLLEAIKDKVSSEMFYGNSPQTIITKILQKDEQID